MGRLKKISIVLNTLRFMKPKQVYYQLYYRFRNKFGKSDFIKKLQSEARQLEFTEGIINPVSFRNENEFFFLNKSNRFGNEIDWNYSGYGKLWTYNLNYFDFLNQEGLTSESGMRLIRDYIAKDHILKDGKEPYTISLRGINWIRFLSNFEIKDHEIDQILYNHYLHLYNSIEYHILGNHLLENGFSLLFGAYYFKDEIFLKKAEKIISNELREQILSDGAHFELSPMYHQIILHRTLDCLNLVQNNHFKKDKSKDLMISTAVKMLQWLEAITYENGNIPMVNDSTFSIAPTTQELRNYARRIGLDWRKGNLTDSGYRKWTSEKYELLIDVGRIGASYIPGHAHADTFNFELTVSGNAFIVDTGISTYEKNSIRQSERSTHAHNTVEINGTNSSIVWGGFRVAQRAGIINFEEDENMISAEHNGYRKFGMKHKRTFLRSPEYLLIKDELIGKSDVSSIAFLHFHPLIKEIRIERNKLFFDEGKMSIQFEGEDLFIHLESYKYCKGFNTTVEAKVVKVNFVKSLQTQFNL